MSPLISFIKDRTVIRNMCPRPLSAPGCSWEHKQGGKIGGIDESYLVHLLLIEFLREMCVKNIFHWEKAACSNTGYNGQGSEFVKHTEVCGYTALLSLKGTVVYKRKIFVLAVSTNI